MNPIYGNPPMELRKSTVDTGMPSVPRAEKGRKEGFFFDKEKEEFSWFTMMTVPKFGIYHDFCGKKTWILYGFVKYSQIFIWDLPYDLHLIEEFSWNEIHGFSLHRQWNMRILASKHSEGQPANQPGYQGEISFFFHFVTLRRLSWGRKIYMCPFGEDRKKKCTLDLGTGCHTFGVVCSKIDPRWDHGMFFSFLLGVPSCFFPTGYIVFVPQVGSLKNHTLGV